MAQFVNYFEVDLQKPTMPQPLRQMVGEGDINGLRVGAVVTNDGEVVSLGGTCVGKVIRADGVTVTPTGTIDGNVAYVVLDQESCAIEGPIQVSVCWVSGSNITTLLIAYGTVVNTQTGNTIQPSTPIPDLAQLLAAISDMQTATAAATAAAEGALENFAPAFVEATANPAGSYVTYTDGKFYYLPEGHTANTTWANTTKVAVTTGEELTGIKSTLAGCAPVIYPDNLVDPSECVDNAYINYTNGNVTANQKGYFCTGYIPVVVGYEYITNKGRNYAYYDGSKDYISGAAGSIAETSLRIPTNAAFIRFSINKQADGISLPEFLYFRRKPHTGHMVTDVTVANMIKGIQFPGNLITDKNWSDNSYINTEDGGTRLGSGYFCTDYITVTPGHSYRANKGRNLAWYNSSKVYISGSSGTGIQAQVTAPENAAYIRFTINKESDGITNTSLLYFADVNDYDSSVRIPGLVADSTVWCYGKKINWIGDSIVDGQDFDEYVCAALGLVKDNEYGINGSTIALPGSGSDTRHALCARYADMSDDADIIAVSCGTNDFEYAWCPIGTINDADDGTSNRTFYGATKALCKGLIDKYPQKVIFFTTPIKRAQPFEDGNGGEYTQDNVMLTPTSKNKYGKTLMDYADIIREVCGYYSIPVLDMYRESLLNPHITSQQSMFDNVYTHPNTTGQKIMARRVAGWLTQLGYLID